MVGKIKFKANPDNKLYTGVFQGADHGIIRLSTATPTLPVNKQMTPGMGVKFLRDGIDSANLVGMYSVDGQNSYNFFEHEWANHVPDPKALYLIPLLEKFTAVSKFIQTVGLSDMASYGQDGSKVEPNFPWKLRFEPAAGTDFPSDQYHDYTKQLMGIKAGTTLFKVYGLDAPEELNGSSTYMGDIILDS